MMPVFFNCEICGKERSDTPSKYASRKHHFCSRECFNEWMKRNRITVKCAVCGKTKGVAPWEVESNETGLWFCSNEHRLQYHDMKSDINVTELTCEFCNELFEIRNIVLSSSNGKRRFCSKKCEKSWYKKFARVYFNCDHCGKLSDVTKSDYEYSEGHYCSLECKKFHFFRGGPDEVWYDDYAEKLNTFEEVRRDPNNDKILQAKCTYCGKWITPTRNEVVTRISYFSGNGTQESRFYCKNNDCKKQCPIFGQTKYPKGYKKSSSREVQAELRLIVMERDNWECQVCGDNKSLHCHHMEGIKQNPIESADVDLCIILCKNCHKRVHSTYGCRYFDFRCQKPLDFPHAAQ